MKQQSIILANGSPDNIPNKHTETYEKSGRAS